MQTYDILLEQIEALIARAARSRGDDELLEEIEDVLSDGYTVALSGEARMVRLEEELDSLLNSGDRRRARELRMLLTEHRAAERSVATLRSMLARLHHDFVALGGTRLSGRGCVG
jgi:AcrR family transcriptional regulator